MLFTQTDSALLRQPFVILNQEEDEGASEPDRVRPEEAEETETKPEEEDLEGSGEDELPLVKENGEDAEEEDWEEQL